MIQNIAFTVATIVVIIHFVLSMLKDFMNLDERVITKKIKLLQILVLVIPFSFVLIKVVGSENFNTFMTNLDKSLNSKNGLIFLFYFFLNSFILGFVFSFIRVIIYSSREWQILKLWDEYYALIDSFKEINYTNDEFINLLKALMEKKALFIEKASLRTMLKAFLLGNIQEARNELNQLTQEQIKLLQDYNKIKSQQ